MLDLEIADVGSKPKVPWLRVLVHDGRRDRPIVVEVDLQRGAAAADLGVVVILLDEGAVVDGDPAGPRLADCVSRSA